MIKIDELANVKLDFDRCSLRVSGENQIKILRLALEILDAAIPWYMSHGVPKVVEVGTELQKNRDNIKNFLKFTEMTTQLTASGMAGI